MIIPTCFKLIILPKSEITSVLYFNVNYTELIHYMFLSILFLLPCPEAMWLLKDWPFDKILIFVFRYYWLVSHQLYVYWCLIQPNKAAPDSKYGKRFPIISDCTAAPGLVVNDWEIIKLSLWPNMTGPYSGGQVRARSPVFPQFKPSSHWADS